ncbi:hypothetical protein GOBAR_AA19466 [Gossypium barbadense]|uniref:Uncharacterized protein n=1 Tax=Gossypium barbadense TaxID=3634 RepID=A0A2P5XCX8_GOSBA|nr:hypothetical protein GOBAR_AA19466 [Gossypium barbadense]
MNFVTTARPEGAAQDGHAMKGQHWLVKTVRGVHQYVGSVIGKMYLLSPEERSQQIWVKMSHRLPQHTRRGRGSTTGLLSAPIEDAPPMAAQYLGQFGLDIDVKPHVGINADVPTVIDANAVQSTTEEDNDGVDPKDTITLMYSGDNDDEEEVYRPAPSDTPPNATLDAPPVVRPVIRKNSSCDHYS